MLLLTINDVVKAVHGFTLIFGVVAIATSSMEIEMGIKFVADLLAYMNVILQTPEFRKMDCCMYEFDCRTMHWDPDGNGSWNLKSKIPFIKTNPPGVLTVLPPPVQTEASFWIWLKVLYYNNEFALSVGFSKEELFNNDVRRLLL